METMEKAPLMDVPAPAQPPRKRSSRLVKAACLAGLVCLASLYCRPEWKPWPRGSPYGTFPEPNDPFRFIPCTDATLPPALDDAHPEQSWARLFDPHPEHWSWGNAMAHDSHRPAHEHPHGRPHEHPHHRPHDRPRDRPHGHPHEHGDHDHHRGHGCHRHRDPYAGRGIYLCGYLDVPLDYTNKSDPRIARLAVTKYQVSGLALRPLHRRHRRHRRHPGRKSERTIVIEPGGPGGSGTSMAWRSSEQVTKRLSGGKFDVLGWDPRGVNASLPAVSCFPYDADRDRWALRAGQYREVSPSPKAQLEFADAMSDAVFNACERMHGDLARFVSTAFVARDLEEIRLALGEDELTGYLVSYGTGIGQTYANMFPDSVGRMILDGTEYVRDHRLVGGFGWTALDNVTDAWRDGFLGECINAGPDHCALAKPVCGDRAVVALDGLQARMEALVRSLIERPIPGYTGFSGPSLITYSALVQAIYGALYNARSWPSLAEMLFELEAGNSTLAAAMLERSAWEYDPAMPSPPGKRPSSDELGQLVICADSYDAPDAPGAIGWWESLWANMTHDSWISGNSRFSNVFPCRHFVDYWKPAEVYRGDLNGTLRHPVLLIAETYDPATPLRNGRRLLKEMGKNARLVAHHGYGHSSRDTSNCTDAIAKSFILEGTLPDEQETACVANEKPYMYGVKKDDVSSAVARARDPIEAWDEHLAELAVLNPRLLSRKGI
ncbi:Carboxylesterase A [Tolypocladium capitatum]|uniref:Carboxylesterase A n=1 Tax=Tolypocladium capitatum TaxID=45235 RepID=A0A2K3Q9Z0_9HYPO|nr:Carboxylesterase A [Tolypocladium capitatum]